MKVEAMDSSLKLQVSFAKEPYKRDCILHKITIEADSYVYYNTLRHTQYIFIGSIQEAQ